jgi:hypothetical protein
VDKLIHAGNNGRFTSLKAPPASGKMSLLQTMANKRIAFVNWSTFQKAAGKSDQSATDFVLELAHAEGFTFLSLNRLMSGLDYLVLDDAQCLWDTELWDALLKTLMGALGCPSQDSHGQMPGIRCCILPNP